MRHAFPRLFAAVLILCLSPAALRADLTIHRDRYGVPTIEAATLSDAVYGLGYATAKDNAVRMALNYKQARGRMAEVEGKGQLLTDGFIRSLGIEEMAADRARTMTGEVADLIRAFCDGANRSLTEQKGKLPAWVEPVTSIDVLSMAQITNASMALLDVQKRLLPGMGSNQFAVTGKKSATGSAILSADPHLPWEGMLLWYEYGIHTPELQFHGVTLAGLPFGVMGHTDRVAWCMTNNDPDLYDFFTVKVNPENTKQYSYHGEWRDFENVNVELRYREDGQLKTQKQTVRKTAWGPMLPFQSRALALTMVGSWDLLDESLAMARAKDAAQFREALKLRGIAMWNIVYADTTGKIGYQYNARIPTKDKYIDWTGTVAGDDPNTKWGPLWELDKLPHVENPKSEFLVNCNSSPWLTATSNEIKNFGLPGYVTSYGHTTRYDRLSSLLLADQKVTLDDAKRYATDTLVPYGLSARDRLVAALDPSRAPSLLSEDARAAGDVLRRWDGKADVGSVGCALYAYWLRADPSMQELARRAAAELPWTSAELLTAVNALDKAAVALKKDHGRLDVPWGAVHVAKRGEKTVPVAGYGYLTRGDDTAAVMPTWGSFKDGKVECTGGSSFRMIVDLNPKGIRSWSILPYGNSQDPSSPNYGDQIPLYARGQYKPVLFGEAAIRKSAVSRQVLRRAGSGE